MSHVSKISRHYQEEAGAHYAQHHQADPFGRGYALDFEYFEPFLDADDAVLDFGCGNGGMLRLIAEQVSVAEGLEVNPHAAASARDLGLKIFSSLADLPDGPRYDVVVSNHVLEHIRDVPSTMETLRDHMKPGGLLLLKLPMEDWRAGDQQRWSRDDIDHHLQTWTPRLIANVCFESGFDIDRIDVITSAWHPKLFPLAKVGLDRLAYWALAVLKRRRQLFVAARKPTDR